VSAPKPNRYTDPLGYEAAAEAERVEGTAKAAAASDTYEDVDHTIELLAERNVYQRSGQLIMVAREAKNEDGAVRPVGAPTIRSLPQVRLAEIITTTLAQPLLAQAQCEHEEELAACESDDDRDLIIAAWEERMARTLKKAQQVGNHHAVTILARGEWAHVRPLDAIVTYPTMRPDGSILASTGYDSATRTLAEISAEAEVQVPDDPTLEDARAAIEVLSDLVSDFPFAGEAHRSAWLATLLTPLARPAIGDAPTPMLLLDASARGSGKTLLAGVIGTIVLGASPPCRTAPETAEEWRKVIMAMLLAGDPIVLIDNVTRMLASAALDSVLTAPDGRYADRILGVSEERRVAIRVTLIASTNNARLSSDLVRRTLLCRLEPDVERPEQRKGWAIPDLLGHVREYRASYLAAALTILRAYASAGRPQVDARPMGSYSAWCRVVRDALVWAGAPDPAETQDALRDSADVERDELGDVLREWHGLLSDRAITTAQLLEAARAGKAPDTSAPKSKKGGGPAWMGAGSGGERPLLEALRGIMPDGAEPNSRRIGNRLRALRGQIIGGLVLREGDGARGGWATWRVLPVGR
jgi:hypothetical protein